jgi:hypothetical protein
MKANVEIPDGKVCNFLNGQSCPLFYEDSGHEARYYCNLFKKELDMVDNSFLNRKIAKCNECLALMKEKGNQEITILEYITGTEQKILQRRNEAIENRIKELLTHFDIPELNEKYFKEKGYELYSTCNTDGTQIEYIMSQKGMRKAQFTVIEKKNAIEVGKIIYFE